MLAGQGFTVTMWNVVTVGLRRPIVPANLLGRVDSVYRVLGCGLMPVGALAGSSSRTPRACAPPTVVGLLCGRACSPPSRSFRRRAAASRGEAIGSARHRTG